MSTTGRDTEQAYSQLHSLMRAVGQTLNTDMLIKLNSANISADSRTQVTLYGRVCSAVEKAAAPENSLRLSKQSRAELAVSGAFF